MIRKIGCMAVLFSFLAAGSAFGESWENTPLGWMYKTKDETYHKNTWQWIDGNGDGIAECYYFNEEGYLLLDTVTPDGYRVNGDGAWVEGDQVQSQSQTQSQTQNPGLEEGIVLLAPGESPGNRNPNQTKEVVMNVGPSSDVKVSSDDSASSGVKPVSGDSVSSGVKPSSGAAPSLSEDEDNSGNFLLSEGISLDRSYSSARSQAEKNKLAKEIERQLAELYENPSHEVAVKHMVWVEVPVWRLKDGEKVSDTAKVQVLDRVAEDVRAIFKEIYEGPEKFPIKYIGGYNWRANGLKSKHSSGLAIDINPYENPQVDANGNVLVGNKWEPGVNPYSIKEDGDVVRAFRNRNWIWGNRFRRPDYMHFEF